MGDGDAMGDPSRAGRTPEVRRLLERSRDRIARAVEQMDPSATAALHGSGSSRDAKVTAAVDRNGILVGLRIDEDALTDGVSAVRDDVLAATARAVEELRSASAAIMGGALVRPPDPERSLIARPEEGRATPRGGHADMIEELSTLTVTERSPDRLAAVELDRHGQLRDLRIETRATALPADELARLILTTLRGALGRLEAEVERVAAADGSAAAAGLRELYREMLTPHLRS